MKPLLAALFLMGVLCGAAAAQPLPNRIPFLDCGKWGYADSIGRVTVTPQWTNAGFFTAGRARVYEGQTMAVIDEKGGYIIPPYRHWNGTSYSSLLNAYYNARGKDGKFGIIDSNNRELLPCLYDETPSGNGYTSSGAFLWDERQHTYAAKAVKNGKFGIIDTLNRTLIPFAYDGIAMDGYPFSSPRYYTVLKNELTGLIDARNRQIFPPVYHNIWLDSEDPNQIMLFSTIDNTTVIADTNGHIVWDIPGYRLGFVRHGHIPVENSKGMHGIMNAKKELVFPCEYIATWITGDTIVLSRWQNDSSGTQTQYMRYYGVRDYKALSGWISINETTGPAPTATAPVVSGRPPDVRLPHATTMRIKGETVQDYRIGAFRWGAVDAPKWPELLYPVKGIRDGDSLARYAAVIDSAGRYVVAPQATDAVLRVINATDKLVLVQTQERGQPRYSITDVGGAVLLPAQQYPVANAFFHNSTFYAITQHDHPYDVRFHNFEHSGTSTVHRYTYYLVGTDGLTVPAFRPYTLRWITDQEGYRPGTGIWDRSRVGDERFNGAITGYFMVRDTLGRSGVVSMDGKVELPGLSFQYRELNRIGPDVFMVDNRMPQRVRGDLDYLIRPKTPVTEGLLYGFPYLVDRRNAVLLDSLSTETAIPVTEFGDGALYRVFLRRGEHFNGHDIDFYMDRKGKGFFRNLPGARKRSGKRE